MNIYKNKLVSRFGLMHMIATNICVWFNVLILETYHEIADMQHKRGEMESVTHHRRDTYDAHENELFPPSVTCLRQSQVMSGLLARSGPFLFPCTIEYSLISAAVLYMMWKNISDEHNHYKTHKRRNKISFTMRIPLQSNEEELARNQASYYLMYEQAPSVLNGEVKSLLVIFPASIQSIAPMRTTASSVAF